MSEKNNVVTFPNKSPNTEQKNTRFLRTEEGIFRYSKKGDEKSLIQITTDGLLPKLQQVIKQIHPGDKVEKIRVIQVGNKRARIDSDTWRKPVALARAIDLIKDPRGQFIEKQEVYLSSALDEEEQYVEHKIEYHHTGWHEGQFLIPNSPHLTSDEAVISELPYSVSKGDEEKALQALNQLFSTVETNGPILFAALLLAPLLKALRLPRFGMFLSASAGMGKTDMLKLLMCFYGRRWAGDEILSFAGTTDNAALKLAESAKDLPFPIDNFRPQDGHIQLLKRLTSAIMEGKSKARLDRTGALKEQIEICCLPIITGEDFPEGDAGMLGRYLILDFKPTKRLDSSDWLHLKKQIELNLSSLGQRWISYLTSSLSQEEFLQKAETQYKLILDYWHARMKKQGTKNSQNIERVIKNISALQLAWELALEYPAFKEELVKHNSNFSKGCINLLNSMISRNEAKSLGTIAIELLKDGLLAKTVHLQKPGMSISNPGPRQENLGWHGEEDTVHLLRTPFMVWLQKQHPSSFSNLSETALSKAFEQESLIASREEGRYTTNIRVDGRIQRVLHLKLASE